MYSKYIEKFPESFSIKHKMTPHTEKRNFHLHQQMEIMLALSSNIKCKLESGKVIQLPQNGMILLGAMDLHYLYTEEGSGVCDRYVLYFSSDYVMHLSTPEINLLECFLIRRNREPVILSSPGEKSLNCLLQLLKKMEAVSQIEENKMYGKELHQKFLLGHFLLMINDLYHQQFPEYSKESSETKNMEILYDILQYIHRHYSENLCAEEISRLFLISKTQLYYLFKNALGTTAADYVQEYRITKAKDLLINSNQQIELVSQAVGYENSSSFSRTFKQSTGMSPLQYRKKHIRP